jgi:hypothetical protein
LFVLIDSSAKYRYKYSGYMIAGEGEIVLMRIDSAGRMVPVLGLRRTAGTARINERSMYVTT